MNAAERRIKITHLLAQSDGPVSATALAAQCGVSRQIIVGDVALLRAGGLAVLATPRGYILENPAAPVYAERRVVCHHGDERLREELYTVVDLGGALIDVTVEHPVYGQICAPLHIFSRFDADAFCKKIQNPGTRPLCDLTGGNVFRMVGDSRLLTGLLSSKCRLSVRYRKNARIAETLRAREVPLRPKSVAVLFCCVGRSPDIYSR